MTGKIERDESGDKRITLRISTSLYEQLKVEAFEARRSLNQFIEHCLEDRVGGSAAVKFRNTGASFWEVIQGATIIGEIVPATKFGYRFIRAADGKVVERDYFGNLKNWVRLSIQRGDSHADRVA